MFPNVLKLSNKSNKVLGRAYIWKERHHYWVKYYFKEKKRAPKKHNVGQKTVQGFVKELLNSGWQVFVKMPEEKGR